MKKIVTLLISAAMVFALCIPAFAVEAPEEETKDFYPIEGSWKLDKVYNIIDGQEPEEIKEEAQSLYGTGINIFTFDEDGYAHDMLFAGPDSMDTAAEWKTTKPNVYVYTEENGVEFVFTYEEEKDVLHRSFEIPDEDAPYKNLDFVYARAIVGSWKLDQVLEIHEGDAPVEMAKEENQSLYAEDENVLTFKVGGTVEELVKGGGEEFTEEGTWEMPEPDKFVYTIDTIETDVEYFRVEDTLFRDVKTEEDQPYLRFIYVRAEEPEEDETAEAPAAQEPAGQTEPQAQPSGEEDELIADGQIFTGNKIYNMVIAATGEYVTLSELNQGGWANEETGEIFFWETPQDGDPKAMYGDKGTVLWIDTVYIQMQDAELVEDFDGGYAGYNYTDDDFDGGYAGSNYTDDDGPVIVDYMQDGTPVYSDDPRIIDFTQDGSPVYAQPEGTIYYEEGEGPVVVDYMQDGTPVYSDDPRIIDFTQDGSPVYAIPEDSYLVDYDDYDED